VTVDNLEEAIEFFTQGLDCTVTSKRSLKGTYLGQALGDNGIESAEIALLSFNEGPVLELVQYESITKTNFRKITSYGVQHFAHFVESVDDSISKLEKLGCINLGWDKTVIPRGPYENRRIAFLRGPYNLILELIQDS
jgi:catechol 2,3-dioxygenase-like lactoylglutathione lyase family enzyme